VELYESGHPGWLWNRLQEIAVEDIGPADRDLPATIRTLREWSDTKRKAKKGGGMEAVQATILLATARKSRLAALMVIEALSDHADRLEIPDEALAWVPQLMSRSTARQPWFCRQNMVFCGVGACI